MIFVFINETQMGKETRKKKFLLRRRMISCKCISLLIEVCRDCSVGGRGISPLSLQGVDVDHTTVPTWILCSLFMM